MTVLELLVFWVLGCLRVYLAHKKVGKCFLSLYFYVVLPSWRNVYKLSYRLQGKTNPLRRDSPVKFLKKRAPHYSNIPPCLVQVASH